MYLHRNLEDLELIDLLAIHTNRFTHIMIYGESYTGEHQTCRRTIELIQAEVLSRRRFYINKVSYGNQLNQSSAA